MGSRTRGQLLQRHMGPGSDDGSFMATPPRTARRGRGPPHARSQPRGAVAGRGGGAQLRRASSREASAMSPRQPKTHPKRQFLIFRFVRAIEHPDLRQNSGAPARYADTPLPKDQADHVSGRRRWLLPTRRPRALRPAQPPT